MSDVPNSGFAKKICLPERMMPANLALIEAGGELNLEISNSKQAQMPVRSDSNDVRQSRCPTMFVDAALSDTRGRRVAAACI